MGRETVKRHLILEIGRAHSIDLPLINLVCSDYGSDMNCLVYVFGRRRDGVEANLNRNCISSLVLSFPQRYLV